MDDEEYIEKYKAIDFQMKMQKQLIYTATKRAISEVVNEMFAKEEEN